MLHVLESEVFIPEGAGGGSWGTDLAWPPLSEFSGSAKGNFVQGILNMRTQTAGKIKI